MNKVYIHPTAVVDKTAIIGDGTRVWHFACVREDAQIGRGAREFRTVIADGETWEVPVTFSFIEASRFEDGFVVKKISINDAVFVVDCSSTWDSENMVFLYQLLFELWLYDMPSLSFQYHNRFVGIHLNATISLIL